MRMPTEINEVNFPQCLVNAGERDAQKLLQDIMAMNPEERGRNLAQMLPDDAFDVHPVYHAVERVAEGSAGEYGKELDYYSDYIELFVESCWKYLHIPCVVEPYPVTESTRLKGMTYVVSQRVSGDISIVGSVLTGEKVFLEMARAFSGEDLQEVDGMAYDSMEEFINVFSGLYSIQLAEKTQSKDVELDLPRYGVNVIPEGSQKLEIALASSVGRFEVILAMDEFF